MQLAQGDEIFKMSLRFIMAGQHFNFLKKVKINALY
jgi:hypothetical protein